MANEICLLWLFFFCFFLLLNNTDPSNSSAVVIARSSVTIQTSPEGPTYPAATWLRLACRHNHTEQHRLQYTWTGSCNSTSVPSLVVSDPLYDHFGWAVIWVQSTPVECLDRFVCSVFLRDGHSEGSLTQITSELFILHDIVGKLFSFQNDERLILLTLT